MQAAPCAGSPPSGPALPGGLRPGRKPLSGEAWGFVGHTSKGIRARTTLKQGHGLWFPDMLGLRSLEPRTLHTGDRSPLPPLVQLCSALATQGGGAFRGGSGSPGAGLGLPWNDSTLVAVLNAAAPGPSLCCPDPYFLPLSVLRAVLFPTEGG